MKKVVGASATACLMMVALLSGCDNKCGLPLNCDPCATPAATSAKVARVATVTADNSLPCIAVLPFQCVDTNPESGIIVADALAGSLASFDGCVVYSPDMVTSQIKFKDGEVVDPIVVGKKMNAPYVLTGRVTEYEVAGEEGMASVGVTARLIDATTGQEIWTAKRYEEYMNGTLGKWSDAVSADLAQAIDLATPPIAEEALDKAVTDATKEVAAAASEPAEVIAPLPVVEIQTEEEDLADADDFDDLVELLGSNVTVDVEIDEPMASVPQQMEEIRFNSDVEPWDFGLEEPEPSRGPIGEEFGVVASSPLTARYGTPTLPTQKVGLILDQFEDPNPPRIITPASPERAIMASTGTADELGLGVGAVAITAPAAKATAADTLPDTVEAPEEMPAASVYAMNGKASDGSIDYTQYHYTGANPFADGPGKKVKEQPIDSFIESEFGSVAIIEAANEPVRPAVKAAPASLKPPADGGYYNDLPDTLTAFVPEESPYLSDLIPELPSDMSNLMPELPSLQHEFAPETPTAMGEVNEESRPNLYMPTPLEPMALSDVSAMAAPDLPEEDVPSREVMYMPEPLTTEPAPSSMSNEVFPSDDGTFKVTISAEQFLNDDAFDFFGNLSTKLEDLDDIEG